MIRIFGKVRRHLYIETTNCEILMKEVNPDSKVHGAIMGPTWFLSAPGGPHVGPMNLAIWELKQIMSVLYQ